MTTDCVTLWIGDALGPVERACLRSVMRHGHSLALYCYSKPRGIPEGVEVRDASDVIRQSAVFFQRNGSVAAFSDWFRYELQRRRAGTWVDTDVYLLRSLDMRAPYLLGEEEPGMINNAVLRLPADLPLLEPLLQLFEKRTTPRWLPWRSYLRARAEELVRGGVNLSRLPWGATGPVALTELMRRFDLTSLAHPSEVFNPMPWSKADWILNPQISLGDVTTERTVSVHLWNRCIESFKNTPAKSGSFLERLQREGRE